MLRLLRLRLQNTGLCGPAGSSPIDAARQVARADALDLDDVGAVIAEHLGGARAHHHLGEVDDAHAGERLRGSAARRRGWIC